MKKERGITLVALVVTIIVLLIRAGVALGLTLSNNGIIERSKKSVAAYRNAEVNEQTDMSVAIDEWDRIVEGDSGDVSGDGKLSIGTDITKANLGSYIGKKVLNYKGIQDDDSETESVTIDGTTYNVSTIYRLYYVDFDNKFGEGAGTIFLKAETGPNKYTLKKEVNEISTSKIQSLNPHLYKDDSNTDITPPDAGNNNMQAVRWLTDTQRWNALKTTAGVSDDVIGKTNYVVGAPSLELMFDSYNTHYNLTESVPNTVALNASSTNKVRLFYEFPPTCNNKTYGYDVGPCNYIGGIYSYYLWTSDYSIKADDSIGFTYWPGSGKDYWIASPSTSTSADSVFNMYTGDGGSVCRAGITGTYSFCPVVSLNNTFRLELE